MRTHLLIPKNLDLEKVLSSCPDMSKKGVSVTSLAYICDCIIYKSIIKRDKFFKNDGFVSLHSKLLDKILPDYSNSTHLLIKCGVIECDKYRIIGAKNFYYRLASEYVGQGWAKVLLSGSIKRRLMQWEAVKNAKFPNVAQLEITRKDLYTTVQSPLLKIYLRAALTWINETYKPLKFKKLIEAGKPEDLAYKLVEQSASNFRFQVVEFMVNRRMPVIDHKGQRLHTPITNLPKGLRKFLTFNGEPLISIDLKNSQPYFSILLLNKLFYTRKKGVLNLAKVDPAFHSLLSTKETTPNMLTKILETLTGAEDLSLQNYTQDALNGILYDRFIEVEKNDPKYDEERDKIKLDFFKVLYDRPTNRGKFIKVYKKPFEVFNYLKSVRTGESKKRRRRKKHNANDTMTACLKNSSPKVFSTDYRSYIGNTWEYYNVDAGYSKLAAILQRLESYLLLDVVCKKLTESLPGIPLITIHDCIATTKEYVKIVEYEIIKTLTDVMGFAPKVTVEPWNK